MKSVAIAILTYNGVHHLEHLLPSCTTAVERYEDDCSIIVLDNRSPREDAAWVRSHFPTVEPVVAPANNFLFSYNWLLARRREEIVILLNNDLKLDPDFISPLVRHFSQEDVFAVCATSRDWEDTRFTCGPARLCSHHGFYYWMYETKRQELAHTFFPSGGFMAVAREKFLALGGFNPLFHPAYGEDLDLGFRAWRRGWRCLFEPASVALHRESGTWGETGERCEQVLGLRSRLLFQWASLPAAAGPFESAAMQILTGCRHLAAGDVNLVRAWVRAWLDWRRLKNDFAWMKTPRPELDEILRRIEEPCALAPT